MPKQRFTHECWKSAWRRQFHHRPHFLDLILNNWRRNNVSSSKTWISIDDEKKRNKHEKRPKDTQTTCITQHVQCKTHTQWEGKGDRERGDDDSILDVSFAKTSIPKNPRSDDDALVAAPTNQKTTWQVIERSMKWQKRIPPLLNTTMEAYVNSLISS